MVSKRLVLVFAVVLGLTLVVGFLVGLQVARPGPVAPGVQREAVVEALPGERLVAMKVPAVDNRGSGVVARLSARVRPGVGDVLVKINDVFPGLQTQNSARIAAQVAANLTRSNLSGVDIIFSLLAPAEVVEGPSAGAAMAVAAAAALENRPLNPGVMITGSVDEKGAVGVVGSIPSKARAAREENATLFLVPPGQNSRASVTGSNRTCEAQGDYEVCRVDFVPRSRDLGDITGIRVVEVKDVADALRYFYEG
ncbi:MAG: hypothetical protein HY558_04815 [Euryarchaeota archaeon]|nr:hypothetical protein [Euryarchaeota archaeon]